MVDTTGYGIGSGMMAVDLPLLVTLFLACFAIVFGTRHTDATEHQDGLILAIAMESVIKLVALLTAGLYILFVIFDGPGISGGRRPKARSPCRRCPTKRRSRAGCC